MADCKLIEHIHMKPKFYPKVKRISLVRVFFAAFAFSAIVAPHALTAWQNTLLFALAAGISSVCAEYLFQIGIIICPLSYILFGAIIASLMLIISDLIYTPFNPFSGILAFIVVTALVAFFRYRIEKNNSSEKV